MPVMRLLLEVPVVERVARWRSEVSRQHGSESIGEKQTPGRFVSRRRWVEHLCDDGVDDERMFDHAGASDRTQVRPTGVVGRSTT
jgi:hypothetical protein